MYQSSVLGAAVQQDANDNLRLSLDQEITRLKSSISDLKTRRDTLPPMAHKFNPNVRRELENEIHGIEIMIRDRRAYRNNLASISRFPDKILASIFMDARDYPSVKIRNRQAPQLAVFSYVSRHWRKIVLETPVLWNSINLDWPRRWVEAWFERSQSAAVDVTMDIALERRNFTSITQLLSASSFRLRRMQLAMDDVEGWIAPLQYPTPLLEYLEIQARKAYPPRLVFPPNFIGGRPLPMLRTFGFYGQHSVWLSPLLVNLTSFKVHQYAHSQRPRVTLRHVLLTLQRMRQLQHLYLEGEVFPDDRENPERLLVELPSMEMITLRGPSARMCIFIDHLMMPTTVSMSLHATTSIDSIEAMTVFMRYLSSHFDPVRLLPTTIPRFNRVTGIQREDDMEIWVDHPDAGSIFSLMLPLASMFERTMRDVCLVLPTEQSQTLCIHAYETSPELWSMILGKMQSIEVLDMGRYSSCKFAYAVTGFVNMWPLLKIHTLGFCFADFELALQDDPALFDTLYNCFILLRERQNLLGLSLRLDKVEVYNCMGVQEEFLRKLRYAGLDVQVDDPAGDGIAQRAQRIQ